jgi:Uma2 family endonuclease
MPIATERPIQQKPITLAEFLAQYGDDDRYELIDGEVFDLEPTGPHEEVAAFIDPKLNVQIDHLKLTFCPNAVSSNPSVIGQDSAPICSF